MDLNEWLQSLQLYSIVKRPLFSIVGSGKGPENKPTKMAALIKARNGCSLNLAIDITTQATETSRTKRGPLDGSVEAARVWEIIP